MHCPKCHYYSGDDWSQCKGDCPMPGSPHYRKMAKTLASAKVGEWVWIKGDQRHNREWRKVQIEAVTRRSIQVHGLGKFDLITGREGPFRGFLGDHVAVGDDERADYEYVRDSSLRNMLSGRIMALTWRDADKLRKIEEILK